MSRSRAGFEVSYSLPGRRGVSRRGPVGGPMSSDPGQPTLFLSYAHGDHAPAQRLARALERAGYTVWWDALIEGGTRYARSINEALEAADAVLVLWSKI